MRVNCDLICYASRRINKARAQQRTQKKTPRNKKQTKITLENYIKYAEFIYNYAYGISDRVYDD